MITVLLAPARFANIPASPVPAPSSMTVFESEEKRGKGPSSRYSARRTEAFQRKCENSVRDVLVRGLARERVTGPKRGDM